MRHLPLIRVISFIVPALFVQAIWARSAAAGGAYGFHSYLHQFDGQLQVLRFNADIGKANSVLCEEAEQKARKKNDAALLYAQMLQTASAYVVEHQFDKAEKKWTEALAEVQTKVVEDQDPEVQERVPKQMRTRDRFYYRRYVRSISLQRSEVAGKLLYIGRKFELEGQPEAAEKVYTAAYVFSSGSSRMGPEIRIEVDGLANTLRTSGDIVGGIRLLEKFLSLCREYQNDASPEVGLWQLKLANYYATIGDIKRTKTLCHDFLKTLAKSDLKAADRATIDSMVENTHVLRTHGFKLESDRVNRKLTAMHKREA